MDATLYTRCPACHTVFQLEAKHLAQAGGVAQCGGCRKVFNVLAALFDDWPTAQDTPASTGGMPPVLPAPSQGSLNLPDPIPDDATPVIFDTESDADDGRPPVLVLDDSPAPPPAWHGYAWRAGAALLALGLVVQLISMDSAQRAALFGAGAPAGPQGADAVQLVARDLHRHPSLDDAVVVSATLVNRAGHPVPYPVIEVRLFDASQQIIGVRRLEPDEYLSQDDAANGQMAPDVMLPVLLELVAGDGDPQGFEFRFL